MKALLAAGQGDVGAAAEKLKNGDSLERPGDSAIPAGFGTRVAVEATSQTNVCGRAAREATMNAIQLLKKEHETAKGMFAQIREANGEERRKLWAKLEPELKVHEQIEEAALYGPVAQEVGSSDPTLQEWYEHHHEEVTELESLIKEISGLDPTADQWLDDVEELQQTLEHHIEEEEGDIWPRIQQVWDRPKLESAGQQMEKLKREKTSRAA